MSSPGAQPVSGNPSSLGSSPRLGRALFYVHQQLLHTQQLVVRSKLGQLIAAGEAMDYAVRLRGYEEGLTPALAVELATQAGFPPYRLYQEVLPKLKAADLIDYQPALQGSGLAFIQEFVGLTGRVIDQAMRVVEQYGPTDVERAVLHSTEIASWAPLTKTQHADQLGKRGFGDEDVAEAIQLGLAAGINKQVMSDHLKEQVVYNPNVWGAQSAEIAGFLRSLPPAERDSLLGICEQASGSPGLALSGYSGFSTPVLTSARKVGLIQAATVKSSRTGANPQTYIFSPLMEINDDGLVSTEALHHRKLFVAHILYGHEKAVAGGGRIYDPRVLVGALLRRGSVGPASNIATDYHLLEARGIVAVRPAQNGRAYLEAVKEDVIEGGLAWLQRSLADSKGGVEADMDRLAPPNDWNTPERDRSNLTDEGEAAEITTSAILRLREARLEAQRDVRFEF